MEPIEKARFDTLYQQLNPSMLCSKLLFTWNEISGESQ